jgi:hypothetical protein
VPQQDRVVGRPVTCGFVWLHANRRAGKTPSGKAWAAVECSRYQWKSCTTASCSWRRSEAIVGVG